MRRAFTLLELLVVVVIIGILAAILVPSLQGAMTRARATACAAGLKNIGVGLAAYLDENAGVMPDGAQMPSINAPPHIPLPIAMAAQVENPRAWRCPADTKGYVRLVDGRAFDSYFAGETISYEFNGSLAGKKIENWRMYRIFGDSLTYVLADFDNVHGKEGELKSKNVLFADKHVGTVQDIHDKAGHPGAETQPN